MQSDLLLLIASLKKTLQTLKSKQSEAGTSFVRYSGNTSVFSHTKSPAIELYPGNEPVKELKF